MTQSDRPANGGRDDARPSERNRKRNIVDDGLRPDLVRGASFCGILEMPLIKAPKHIITPTGMVPWSRRGYDHIPDDFVCFYEMDPLFSDVLLAVDEHVEELTRFAGVISPDCSLYYEMPLAAQIANTYLNRSVGYQLQQRGLYVVPNIRWGDERTYTTCELPEKLAFLGVEKRSVVSIGAYGVSKTSRERYHMRAGLEAMLEELEPRVVLVYGAMPKDVFSGLEDCTEFLNYPDWISRQKGGRNG